MKIQDALNLGNDRKTWDLKTEQVTILTKSGEQLYTLRLREDGVTLEISVGRLCKVNDVIRDDVLEIIPQSRGRIVIRRPELDYER